MSWVRIDDGFSEHEKVIAVGRDGLVLYVRALCWSSRRITDGYIPVEVLPQLGFDFAWLGMPERLVEAGLWENRNDGGYWIHDYLEYNPSKKQVQERRKANQKTVKRWRKRNASGKRDVMQLELDGKPEVLLSPTPSPSSVELERFVRTLKDNPAYKNIDIDIELGKMDAWISAKPKASRIRKTKRRVVNWMNTAVERAGFAIGGNRPKPKFGVFTSEPRSTE